MAAGVGSALWVLVVILAVNSAIGLYYYLRIVAALFSVPAELETQEIAAVEFSNGIMVSVLAVIIFVLGIYPAPVLRIVRDAIAGFI
jgi:NADH-quinone oxidoreductase subunit N